MTHSRRAVTTSDTSCWQALLVVSASFALLVPFMVGDGWLSGCWRSSVLGSS